MKTSDGFITTHKKTEGTTKKIVIERAIDWDGYIITIEKADGKLFYRPAWGKKILLDVLKQEIYA